MNFKSFLKILSLLLLVRTPLRAGEINFVYPAEDASIPDVPKTFVFGNISPATAPFTINGERIAVHANGGFIAYLSISAGDFSFTGALGDGTTVQRRLKVKGPASPKSDEDEVWLALNSMSSDIEVRPSEYVKVQAAGMPGKEALFSIEGMISDEPMTEMPPGSGRYFGAYRVKDSDAGSEGLVRIRFKTGLFSSDAETESKGRVKVLTSETLVETSTDTVILRNASDGGYMMFLPKGVKLVTNGRAGGMRRVALSAGETAWVDDSKVQPAPSGQFPAPPFTETGTIRLKKTDYGSQAAVTLYDRVPYIAEEKPGGLRLTLYYANLHTNWVVYDSSDTFVKDVVFRQAATCKAEIDFETGPEAVWGYDISYSGRTLLVDLRRRPAPVVAWPKPLSGLTVVLDPGHSPKFTSPYDGAIGPKATFEFQVNLAIAQKLREELLMLGASVQLTRTGDENVPLVDRPKMAKDLGGDLFISVHNNALADGEDPFAQPRGFSVYYYHRHSLALADAIHRSYMRNVPLPDEGLRYGDYLVARLTWMPAVLIENAYMIFPQQEEMLNDPSFQERLAAVIAEGVLDFFKAPPNRSRKTAVRPKKEPQQSKKNSGRMKENPGPSGKSGPPAVKAPVRPKKVKNVRHP